MTIPLILIGYVLQQNPQWFNGAGTVGDWAFWIGVIGLAIQVLWVVGVLIIGILVARD